MTEAKASRTLVKSTPELWAECSDAAALARHLGAFGEIRITRLEPETAVAWEGDDVSGTVTLEPAGWGTRVILTASAVGTADSGAGLDPGAGLDLGAVPDPRAVPDPGAGLNPGAVLDPGAVLNPSAVPDDGAIPDPPPEPGAPAPPSEPDLSDADQPEPIPRQSWIVRLRARLRRPRPDSEPEQSVDGAGTATEPFGPVAPPGPVLSAVHGSQIAGAPPEIEAPAPAELAALLGALDSLGTAHRRPFSHG